MKEGEQSRDYNERVSAVWRLSRSAAMYKGGLQVSSASTLAVSALIFATGCQHACDERMRRDGPVVNWFAFDLLRLDSKRLLCRYGGLLVIRGPQELSTGQLTAYILYVIYSVFAITQLIATINSNTAAASAAARVGEILNRRPLAAVERGQALTNFRGLIEFKNVCPPLKQLPNTLRGASFIGVASNVLLQVHFSHPQQPDRPSLSGLTFTCRPSTITVRYPSEEPHCAAPESICNLTAWL